MNFSPKYRKVFCKSHLKSLAVTLPFFTSIKNSKGFTLLETLIYVALAGIIIVGIVVTVYPIFTSTDKITANISREGETVFVLRKIYWMLNHSSFVSVPTSDELRITLDGGTNVRFKQGIGSIDMSTNGGVNWVPLTASRVTFNNFLVTHVPPANNLPRYVEITFDSNGTVFGPVRKYLRY